jgi:hypothetical protein
MLTHFLRVAANKKPTIEYIGLVESSSVSSSYTFTNANIGGPGLIIVAVHSEQNSTSTLNSVTIGGSAATIAVNGNLSGELITAFAAREITSGSTATIVVTYSGAQDCCRVAVWRVTNYNSETALATNSASAASGSGQSLTLNSLPVGAVAVAAYSVTVENIRVTWTGVTEKYDSNIASATTSGTGGDATTTVAGNLTISTAHSSTNNAQLLVAAAWK